MARITGDLHRHQHQRCRRRFAATSDLGCQRECWCRHDQSQYCWNGRPYHHAFDGASDDHWPSHHQRNNGSDFAGTPLIVLTDGAGTVTDGFVLGSGSDGSTIRGFVIQGFNTGLMQPILVRTRSLEITSHQLDRKRCGRKHSCQWLEPLELGEQHYWWYIRVGSERHFWNIQHRININGTSTGNQIRGNYIGVGADGSTDVGNRWYGIYSSSSGNTIGESVAGAGNVISGTVHRAEAHLCLPYHDGLWYHGSGQYHRLNAPYSGGSQRWHWNACLFEQQHHRRHHCRNTKRHLG